MKGQPCAVSERGRHRKALLSRNNYHRKRKWKTIAKRSGEKTFFLALGAVHAASMSCQNQTLENVNNSQNDDNTGARVESDTNSSSGFFNSFARAFTGEMENFYGMDTAPLTTVEPPREKPMKNLAVKQLGVVLHPKHVQRDKPVELCSNGSKNGKVTMETVTLPIFSEQAKHQDNTNEIKTDAISTHIPVEIVRNILQNPEKEKVKFLNANFFTNFKKNQSKASSKELKSKPIKRVPYVSVSKPSTKPTSFKQYLLSTGVKSNHSRKLESTNQKEFDQNNLLANNASITDDRSAGPDGKKFNLPEFEKLHEAKELALEEASKFEAAKDFALQEANKFDAAKEQALHEASKLKVASNHALQEANKFQIAKEEVLKEANKLEIAKEKALLKVNEIEVKEKSTPKGSIKNDSATNDNKVDVTIRSTEQGVKLGIGGKDSVEIVKKDKMDYSQKKSEVKQKMNPSADITRKENKGNEVIDKKEKPNSSIDVKESMDGPKKFESNVSKDTKEQPTWKMIVLDQSPITAESSAEGNKDSIIKGKDEQSLQIIPGTEGDKTVTDMESKTNEIRDGLNGNEEYKSKPLIDIFSQAEGDSNVMKYQEISKAVTSDLNSLEEFCIFTSGKERKEMSVMVSQIGSVGIKSKNVEPSLEFGSVMTSFDKQNLPLETGKNLKEKENLPINLVPECLPGIQSGHVPNSTTAEGDCELQTNDLNTVNFADLTRKENINAIHCPEDDDTLMDLDTCNKAYKMDVYHENEEEHEPVYNHVPNDSDVLLMECFNCEEEKDTVTQEQQEIVKLLDDFVPRIDKDGLNHPDSILNTIQAYNGLTAEYLNNSNKTKQISKELNNIRTQNNVKKMSSILGKDNKSMPTVLTPSVYDMTKTPDEKSLPPSTYLKQMTKMSDSKNEFKTHKGTLTLVADQTGCSLTKEKLIINGNEANFKDQSSDDKDQAQHVVEGISSFNKTPPSLTVAKNASLIIENLTNPLNPFSTKNNTVASKYSEIPIGKTSRNVLSTRNYLRNRSNTKQITKSVPFLRLLKQSTFPRPLKLSTSTMDKHSQEDNCKIQDVHTFCDNYRDGSNGLLPPSQEVRNVDGCGEESREPNIVASFNSMFAGLSDGNLTTDPMLESPHQTNRRMRNKSIDNDSHYPAQTLQEQKPSIVHFSSTAKANKEIKLKKTNGAIRKSRFKNPYISKKPSLNRKIGTFLAFLQQRKNGYDVDDFDDGLSFRSKQKQVTHTDATNGPPTCSLSQSGLNLHEGVNKDWDSEKIHLSLSRSNEVLRKSYRNVPNPRHIVGLLDQESFTTSESISPTITFGAIQECTNLNQDWGNIFTDDFCYPDVENMTKNVIENTTVGSEDIVESTIASIGRNEDEKLATKDALKHTSTSTENEIFSETTKSVPWSNLSKKSKKGPKLKNTKGIKASTFLKNLRSRVEDSTSRKIEIDHGVFARNHSGANIYSSTSPNRNSPKTSISTNKLNANRTRGMYVFKTKSPKISKSNEFKTKKKLTLFESKDKKSTSSDGFDKQLPFESISIENNSVKINSSFDEGLTKATESFESSSLSQNKETAELAPRSSNSFSKKKSSFNSKSIENEKAKKSSSFGRSLTNAIGSFKNKALFENDQSPPKVEFLESDKSKKKSPFKSASIENNVIPPSWSIGKRSTKVTKHSEDILQEGGNESPKVRIFAPGIINRKVIQKSKSNEKLVQTSDSHAPQKPDILEEMPQYPTQLPNISPVSFMQSVPRKSGSKAKKKVKRLSNFGKFLKNRDFDLKSSNIEQTESMNVQDKKDFVSMDEKIYQIGPPNVTDRLPNEYTITSSSDGQKSPKIIDRLGTFKSSTPKNSPSLKRKSPKLSSISKVKFPQKSGSFERKQSNFLSKSQTKIEASGHVEPSSAISLHDKFSDYLESNRIYSKAAVSSIRFASEPIRASSSFYNKAKKSRSLKYKRVGKSAPRYKVSSFGKALAMKDGQDIPTSDEGELVLQTNNLEQKTQKPISFRVHSSDGEGFEIKQRNKNEEKNVDNASADLEKQYSPLDIFERTMNSIFETFENIQSPLSYFMDDKEEKIPDDPNALKKGQNAASYLNARKATRKTELQGEESRRIRSPYRTPSVDKKIVKKSKPKTFASPYRSQSHERINAKSKKILSPKLQFKRSKSIDERMRNRSVSNERRQTKIKKYDPIVKKPTYQFDRFGRRVIENVDSSNVKAPNMSRSLDCLESKPLQKEKKAKKYYKLKRKSTDINDKKLAGSVRMPSPDKIPATKEGQVKQSPKYNQLEKNSTEMNDKKVAVPVKLPSHSEAPATKEGQEKVSTMTTKSREIYPAKYHDNKEAVSNKYLSQKETTSSLKEIPLYKKPVKKEISPKEITAEKEIPQNKMLGQDEISPKKKETHKENNQIKPIVPKEVIPTTIEQKGTLAEERNQQNEEHYSKSYSEHKESRNLNNVDENQSLWKELFNDSKKNENPVPLPTQEKSEGLRENVLPKRYVSTSSLNKETNGWIIHSPRTQRKNNSSRRIKSKNVPTSFKMRGKNVVKITPPEPTIVDHMKEFISDFLIDWKQRNDDCHIFHTDHRDNHLLMSSPLAKAVTQDSKMKSAVRRESPSPARVAQPVATSRDNNMDIQLCSSQQPVIKQPNNGLVSPQMLYRDTGLSPTLQLSQNLSFATPAHDTSVGSSPTQSNTGVSDELKQETVLETTNKSSPICSPKQVSLSSKNEDQSERWDLAQLNVEQVSHDKVLSQSLHDFRQPLSDLSFEETPLNVKCSEAEDMKAPVSIEVCESSNTAGADMQTISAPPDVIQPDKIANTPIIVRSDDVLSPKVLSEQETSPKNVESAGPIVPCEIYKKKIENKAKKALLQDSLSRILSPLTEQSEKSTLSPCNIDILTPLAITTEQQEASPAIAPEAEINFEVMKEQLQAVVSMKEQEHKTIVELQDNTEIKPNSLTSLVEQHQPQKESSDHSSKIQNLEASAVEINCLLPKEVPAERAENISATSSSLSLSQKVSNVERTISDTPSKVSPSSSISCNEQVMSSALENPSTDTKTTEISLIKDVKKRIIERALKVCSDSRLMENDFSSSSEVSTASRREPTMQGLEGESSTVELESNNRLTSSSKSTLKIDIETVNNLKVEPLSETKLIIDTPNLKELSRSTVSEIFYGLQRSRERDESPPTRRFRSTCFTPFYGYKRPEPQQNQSPKEMEDSPCTPWVKAYQNTSSKKHRKLPRNTSTNKILSEQNLGLVRSKRPRNKTCNKTYYADSLTSCMSSSSCSTGASSELSTKKTFKSFNDDIKKALELEEKIMNNLGMGTRCISPTH